MRKVVIFHPCRRLGNINLNGNNFYLYGQNDPSYNGDINRTVKGLDLGGMRHSAAQGLRRACGCAVKPI